MFSDRQFPAFLLITGISAPKGLEDFLTIRTVSSDFSNWDLINNCLRGAEKDLGRSVCVAFHGFSDGVFSVVRVDQFACTLASSQITLITLMPSKLNCIDFIGVIDPCRISETASENRYAS